MASTNGELKREVAGLKFREVLERLFEGNTSFICDAHDLSTLRREGKCTLIFESRGIEHVGFDLDFDISAGEFRVRAHDPTPPDVVRYRVKTCFSPALGGRFIADGEHSGQKFRMIVLEPLLVNFPDSTILLDFTGCWGPCASWISEAFSVLADKVGAEDLRKKIEVFDRDRPQLAERVEAAIREVEKRAG